MVPSRSAISGVVGVVQRFLHVTLNSSTNARALAVVEWQPFPAPTGEAAFQKVGGMAWMLESGGNRSASPRRPLFRTATILPLPSPRRAQPQARNRLLTASL